MLSDLQRNLQREIEAIESDVMALFSEITQGVPQHANVYFIKRTDNTVYATLTNRYLPGEIVLDTMMVDFFRDWSIQTAPVVSGYLRKLQDRIKR